MIWVDFLCFIKSAFFYFIRTKNVSFVVFVNKILSDFENKEKWYSKFETSFIVEKSRQITTDIEFHLLELLDLRWFDGIFTWSKKLNLTGKNVNKHLANILKNAESKVSMPNFELSLISLFLFAGITRFGSWSSSTVFCGSSRWWFVSLASDYYGSTRKSLPGWRLFPHHPLSHGLPLQAAQSGIYHQDLSS